MSIQETQQEMPSKKLVRMYQRMYTGLQIGKNNDADMRFMTLTSGNEGVKNRNGHIRTIRESFDVLRKKIMRATIEKDRFEGFKFNRYFCLRTEEGNGVLHILFWGKYIPNDWLRQKWYDIHGAFEADIRAVSSDESQVNKLTGYLVTNYFANQPKIKRMSYGWKWAWLGFCKSWEKVKETYGLLRRGKGELTHNIIHRSADKAYFLDKFYISAYDRFTFRKWGAWHKLTWEHPNTSRQLKLCGSKSKKWYIPELKIPAVKKEKPKPTWITGEELINSEKFRKYCKNYKEYYESVFYKE